MRNLKKFLALVLAMLMIVSASAAVSASDFSDVADDSIYAEAIADLVEKGITNGVAEGQFGPDQPVQRFQMALFMARALEPDVDDWMTGMQVFDDVNEWYGAIAYAYVNNIVTGMGNNLFAPHDGIRYQDALIMALRALGYKVDVSGDPYWLAAYNQAQALGLTKGVEVYVGEQVLTRAETAQIIYNMLKTTPADGGLTINEKNFGEATPANTTTLVVTATPEQYYAETYRAAQDGYLGLQVIVDGLPYGDVYYYPAEELGIDEDEIENYFGYSFDFVNFVPSTGKYDSVENGLDPVVVYNKDVTKNADDKMTIGNTVYYTVDEFTGAALKNELVILNAGELAYARKVLYTDADGNVVNAAGKIVADYSHKSSTGTKFYSVTELGEDESNLEAGQIITEKDALQVFGIGDSDDSYINYSTLTAKQVAESGNYQMTLFDDDRDGKYERAIVTTVYVNAFNNKSNDAESFGPMMGVKGVVYTEDLTKGDVFTYTYNSQTKTVDVLDILPIQSGILTRINATGIGDKVVKLTIDGEEYTLANDQNLGKVGANIDLNGKNNNVEFEKIAEDAQLGFLYNKTENGGWNELTVGARINFYAIGDQIINAKTYNIEDDYERVILKDIVSYDSENIYVDLYRDGKLEKNVAIASVAGDSIDDLNIFKLSTLLSDKAIWKAGAIYKYIELADDTYELSLPMSHKDAKVSDYGLSEMVTVAKPTIIFVDGIADKQIIGGVTSDIQTNGLMLRTNDDTVFYFIDEDGDVNIYVGAPDNSSIDLSKVTLYADKIGYGENNSGVASFVAVYYDSKDAAAIKGFGFTSVDYSVIFVNGNADSGVADKYERVSASYIGLGSGYSGSYYSYDVDNLAVDMGDGVEVNKVYSKSILKYGHFYKVDSNGVVTEDITNTANIKSATLNKNSFEQTRYYEIGNIVDRDDKVDTVKLAMYNFEGTIKTDDFAWFDTSYNVFYIRDYEDGTFVGIVDIDDDTDTIPNPDKVNATWKTPGGKVLDAVKDLDSDAKGTITLYKSGDGTATGVSTRSEAASANWTAKVMKYDGFDSTEIKGVNVDATLEDGVITINGYKNNLGNKTELAAGDYEIVLTCDNTTPDGKAVEVTFTVTVK